jgi:hypothetical protein
MYTLLSTFAVVAESATQLKVANTTVDMVTLCIVVANDAAHVLDVCVMHDQHRQWKAA